MEKILSLPIKLKFFSQVALLCLISVLSFFVPFIMGHPQWLVGTVVNACLFLAAFLVKDKKYCFLASVLPSLGVLARGMVFGPFTWFLAYFLPFIWLGNLILILVFKKFAITVGAGYIFSAAIAAFAKFLLLFLMAQVYFKLNFVPAIFLQAMGLNQLATAFAGGLISFLLYTILWKAYLKRQGKY